MRKRPTALRRRTRGFRKHHDASNAGAQKSAMMVHTDRFRAIWAQSKGRRYLYRKHSARRRKVGERRTIVTPLIAPSASPTLTLDTHPATPPPYPPSYGGIDMYGDVQRYRGLWDPEGYPPGKAGDADHGQRCRETSAALHFLYSERHVQCLWFDDRWRPGDLHTQAGEPVRVIQPGAWNLEAGPDFARASLAVGAEARRLEGSIEIHIRPGDWHRHRHATDPRYRDLAAHVTWFPGTLAPEDLPPGCLQIALAPAMERVPGFSFDQIDIAAYPYAVPDTPRPPCAEALQTLPVDTAIRFLEAAGRHRLDQKAERLRTALQRGTGRDSLLYSTVMGALGYKRNATACRELARRLPLDVLRDTPDPETAYALLLGVAGLLPPQPGPGWPADARHVLRALWDRWWPRQEVWRTRCMVRTDWTLGGIRPQNHPRRRLAVAASLFGAGAPWLDDPALHAETSGDRDWMADATARLSACNRLPYWEHHQSFAGATTTTPVRLLSSRRAAGILLNAVAPFRLATGLDTADGPLAPPPEPDNAVIRECAHLLLGRDHNPALYNRMGLRQQGLIQIFQEFCLPSRSVCTGCPLADAIRAFARATP